MDDLKLLVLTRNQLEQSLKIIEEFFNNKGMKFGLDWKCLTLNLIRGRIQSKSYDIQDYQTTDAMWIT